MIRRFICGLMLLHGTCAMNSPAIAKECGPLKMLASINLVPRSPNREMVPVIVNGSPRLFVLDTGGGVTQISPRVVQALALETQTGATPLFDLSGNVSIAFAKIGTFSFGGMTGNNTYIRVAPNNVVDGIFGPDLLNRFDVEMDFASQQLKLFLPDHCPGKVVYWPHGDVAQIPIVLADKKSIRVPVKLDGQSLLATIDTGADRTTITANTALTSFGLAPDSPGMKPEGNVNGDRNLASYVHTFSSLALDGVTIQNPRIRVMPDRVTDAETDFAAPSFLSGATNLLAPKLPKTPQLLLGMDVLKYLHLYFAFQEHNLYASAAEPSTGLAATATDRACDPRRGLQLKPIMATHQRPTYSQDAVGPDFQGATVFRVLVNSDGVPISVVTATSSGAPLLDQPAADFIKAHWRWEPIVSACRPVSVNTRIVISWNTYKTNGPLPAGQPDAGQTPPKSTSLLSLSSR